jgi:hypothetical protein
MKGRLYFGKEICVSPQSALQLLLARSPNELMRLCEQGAKRMRPGFCEKVTATSELTSPVELG